MTRAGSADASLNGLSLSGVTLVPAFAAEATVYAATLGNAVTQTTVSATVTDANARVAVTPEDADPMAAGHQVDLAVGSGNVISVVVAEDGVTTQAYTVTEML